MFVAKAWEYFVALFSSSALLTRTLHQKETVNLAESGKLRPAFLPQRVCASIPRAKADGEVCDAGMQSQLLAKLRQRL